MPLAVRGHLVTNWPVLLGSAFFGIGCAFALSFGTETDLLGTFLLDGHHEVAPGWLEGVTKTRYSENDRAVYRYEYSFRDAQGAIHSGVSYSSGRELSYLNPIADAHRARPPNIKVEYWPANSRRNRIVGMRTALCSPFVMLMWVLPPIGLAFLWGGLVSGVRQIRLLRNGSLARISFTSSEQTGGPDQLPEGATGENDRRQQLAKSEVLRGHVLLLHGFAILAALWVGGFFGTLVNFLLLYFFDANHPPFMLSYLVVGLLTYLQILQLARKQRKARARGIEPAVESDVSRVYEFQVPGGKSVSGSDRYSLPTGSRDPVAELVLYDSRRPAVNCRLISFRPTVRLSPDSQWQTDASWLWLLKAIFVVTSLTMGPYVGWTVQLY